MSTGTGISWTNATWNPIAGCTPVSPGCLNCYAAVMSHRLEGMGQAKKYGGLTVLHNKRRIFNGKISFDEAALVVPLSWKKPRRVFVNSMSDLFHPDVPFEFVDRVFAVMALCPQHTFQVLTKRPERMAEYLQYSKEGRTTLSFRWKLSDDYESADPGPEDAIGPFPLPNVWLGTSCEDQQRADERIPHLLRCPAAVRFLSCEPLLGPICLSVKYNTGAAIHNMNCLVGYGGWGDFNRDKYKVHWVIVGGESGHGSRPCDIQWIKSIVDHGDSACGLACDFGIVFRLGYDEGGT